ncbi:GIY-YIG nuclease family protein [Pelosinus sp. UFO1]|uniref:GIY-YIG nuclease family protein n=1 Tax=Pelosinus sp. UFO1 TaxID=484770 RepID=UPI0004D0F1EE|nr:GIY-YIG nuclease family protein [Pelosinus sp. UFO1]AIF51060.1 Excinuclease ABC C subunit domain protein [Pelosinus sp. UFO1]
MPYTYIVQCADDTLYTGWTVDLEKRMIAHNKGIGAKYTSSRIPVVLVYWEQQESQSTAQKREASIKKLTRSQKLTLIREFTNEVT